MKRKIYFIVSSRAWGSSKLRAQQISNKLKDFNLDCQVICYDEISIIEKNTICIWIKFAPKELISLLKSSIHILDVVDAFEHAKKLINEVNFNAIIVNNLYMKNECINDLKIKSKIFTIPHHWDKDLECATLINQSQLNFGYLGSISSLKYDQNLLHANSLSQHKSVKFIDCEFCQDVTDTIRQGFHIRDPLEHERKSINNLSINFNCHLSIRSEQSPLFLYKTSAKIATASLFNHNIITTAEKSAIDILPKNYPFILKNSKLDTVLEMMNLIKKDFYSTKELWNQGLESMRQVKQNLCIDNIINLYKQMLDQQ